MDRVLAFGCHPDDVEFMATGTLALLADRGYEIHIATMTGGEVGSATHKSQEIRDIRLAEADAAAKVIHAQYHYAGSRDLEVQYDDAHRKMTVRIMRQVDPHIVLTLPPSDYLADHEQTSLLVRNAAYIASVPLYDCGVPATPASRIPHLYYWNAVNLTDIFGRPLPLHFGVDVTSVIDTKQRMLETHASQGDWLAHHNDYNAYLELMKDWSRAQGKLIGAEHGECFIQHLGNGHPADNILAEVLGPLCINLN
ncbi:MAG: LmbE family protein [Planctomycetaceae bacterium]|nr:LmbE family protein [Planctomycetaceae bacterium]